MVERFEGAMDLAEDSLQLPELIGVAGDIKSVIDLDEYFIESMPEYEKMTDLDIVRSPGKLNAIIKGALDHLAAADGALEAIGSQLKFSPQFLASYEEKLSSVLDEFESKSYQQYMGLMKIVEADSLVARGLINGAVYDEEIHGVRRRPRLTTEEREAHVSQMIELKANLLSLNGGVSEFKSDFDALKDPDLFDRIEGDKICSNGYVAELLSNENHVDMFKVMHSYLESGALETVMDGDYTSEGLSEKAVLAQDLYADVRMAQLGISDEERSEEAERERYLAKLEEGLKKEGEDQG